MFGESLEGGGQLHYSNERALKRCHRVMVMLGNTKLGQSSH